ncbi:MAG: DNA repair protein RecO [Polyangiales bacterium]
MSAPAEHAAALVLRCVDYGEADRIVTLLTREHGRVSAMARAARKSKRRFAGSLEGFAFISVELAFGRGQLARLVSARVTRSFPRLLGDLARLEAAGALLRLVREVVPERVPDLEVYESVAQLLAALDLAEVPARPLRLVAQAHLLALTGFAPLLHACVTCGKQPGDGQAAMFDPAQGGVVCRSCGGGPERISGSVRGRLQRALHGDVEAVVAEAGAGWSDAELREADRVLGRFVEHVLPRHEAAGHSD